MTTRTCGFCGKSYDGDKSLCPHCHKRYMKGELPFDSIPEKLEPFYDTGLEKLMIPFGFWQECEKIRREASERLKSPEAKVGNSEEQEEFEKKVNDQAKDRANEVIEEYLPILWGEHNLYESADDDPENYKIKF